MLILTKIIILGAIGSMGSLVSKLALEDKQITVVAAVDVNKIGNELGSLVGVEDPNKIKISDAKKLQQIVNDTKPDVAVDFSTAKATETNCMICVKSKVKCVIGTTGLSQDFLNEFEKQVKSLKVPAVISTNMATGVNIFFKIASIITNYVKDWDIEIIEAHHNRKRDNYSGTSLTILNKICETLGVKPDDVAQFGRPKGTALRKKGATNEIGIHCIRAGDIVGNHTVLYAGPGEYIELTHKATSRNCLAEGAIRAIKFITEAKESKIYSMQEVLGIK